MHCILYSVWSVCLLPGHLKTVETFVVGIEDCETKRSEAIQACGCHVTGDHSSFCVRLLSRPMTSKHAKVSSEIRAPLSAAPSIRAAIVSNGDPRRYRHRQRRAPLSTTLRLNELYLRQIRHEQIQCASYRKSCGFFQPGMRCCSGARLFATIVNSLSICIVNSPDNFTTYIVSTYIAVRTGRVALRCHGDRSVAELASIVECRLQTSQ